MDHTFRRLARTFCRPGKALVFTLQSAFTFLMLFPYELVLILMSLRLIMGPSTEAPQQHKQPSRKGKKAWRKNVDVTDVQAGLEEARQEVIKGLVPSIIHLSGF